MAVCRNEQLLNMINKESLEQESVVTFKLIDELNDCKRIIANTYIDIAEMQQYRRRHRPTNRFECEPVGCNTGTLYLGANGYATYKAEYNATEFANGIMTFYVKADTDGKVTVTIADDVKLANADVYEIDFKKSEVTSDGYIPIVVDLSKAPTSVIPAESGGWVPTDNGTYVKIEVSVAAGISSISFYDTIEDFAVNDVIQISCLSSIDGTDELSTIEAACSSPGYDTSDTSPIERTVTGKVFTPNLDRLNPRSKRGDKTVGFEQFTKTFKVEDKDGEYGVVVIPDKATDECGFSKAQLKDACEPTESELTLLSIPKLVDIDEGQYLIIPGEDGSTEYVFNKELVGEEVIITYPRKVQVTDHLEYSIRNVEGKRVEMTHKQLYSDGTKRMTVYRNVYITSFPMGVTNEEQEVEIGFAIQRGMNGKVDYESWRIVG